MALSPLIKKMLNDFSLQQPALNIPGVPYPQSAIKLGDIIDAGTGTQGPKGDTGATGPQGSQGAKGDTGDTGTQGQQGTPGNDGNTILNGVVPPGSSLGRDGDFYIDTATNTIYGPKASGTWPSGVSLGGGGSGNGKSVIIPALANGTVSQIPFTTPVYSSSDGTIKPVDVSDIYYQEKKITKLTPALTPIKLPKRGTYKGDELIVCVNTKRLAHLIHYNYDEKTPRTSVWLTFDLYKGDIITFRLPPEK